MRTTQTIEELIELCRRNDRVAQQIVFDLFKNKMFAICKRYSNSLPDAEDNLIEGFTSVFMKIDTFSGYGSFENWMRRIFINHCISSLRHSVKHSPIERFEESAFMKEEIETEIIYSKEELYDALNSIENRQRMVFNMVAIDGYSYKEAAKEMNASVDVVRTILFRARQNLRKYLLNIKQGQRSSK